MKYILIFVWQAYGGSADTSTATAEFATKPACMAAAAEIRRQAVVDRAKTPLILCAVKE